MNVRPRKSRRTLPTGPPQEMPWKPMKIKYACQCAHCGVALGVDYEAYGKKSVLTGKWLFLCTHCYNNPAYPYNKEEVPIDLCSITPEEPAVEPELEPEIDINNPPKRLKSMKEIIQYAKYKIKWKAA